MFQIILISAVLIAAVFTLIHQRKVSAQPNQLLRWYEETARVQGLEANKHARWQ